MHYRENKHRNDHREFAPEQKSLLSTMALYHLSYDDTYYSDGYP
jgi:hypothetical protein